MNVRTIEISFPVAVDLPDGFERVLDSLLGMVCAQWQRENPTMVMWPAGCGQKPMFSKADAAFLGKPVDQNAPESGEPGFDESVFQIEVAAREDYYGENPHNPDRQRLRNEARAAREARKAKKS